MQYTQCMYDVPFSFHVHQILFAAAASAGVNSTTGTDLCTTCEAGRCWEMKSFGDEETAEELQETTNVLT